ncbi:MAG: VPLPA-CTERM sorting domain-containing protein [Gammaproteobacteria bacterium]|nr:VPLPA-CTERM sorting domain-containing protein [Gammaproteobacteria bacterium]
MKYIIHSFAFSLVGLWSFSAQTATIDFEGFSQGAGGGVYPTTLQSEGYDFSGFTSFNDSMEIIAAGVNTTNAYGGSVSAPGQDGFGVQALIDIERTDGGSFAIFSYELLLNTDNDGFTTITGELAGGGAANLGVPVGTGDWLNLESVRFRAEGNQFGPGFASAAIDNIVINAVPVPAAFWLFGSALAGLGWMRRKQTV